MARIAPASPRGVELMDSYDYELADMAERQTIEEEARAMMESYASKIRGWIKSGEVPAVKFSTMVIEGIPEESILGYARDKNPQLVVMGTRGADKKEAELIGSVTAEVLDSCRIPAFTVPENVDVAELMEMRRVAFLCNLEQEDMIALDTLCRIMKGQSLEVMLVYIPGRRDRGVADAKRSEERRVGKECRL